MRILDNVGLVIDDWGTAVTGPLLDFVTLITTLPMIQFSIQVTGHFPSQSMRTGNLFGWLIVMAGRISLISSLKLSLFNLSLLFLVLPLCTTVKSLVSTSQ